MGDQGGASKWVSDASEKCKQTSERTSEWRSTYVPILGCSELLWAAAVVLQWFFLSRIQTRKERTSTLSLEIVFRNDRDKRGKKLQTPLWSDDEEQSFLTRHFLIAKREWDSQHRQMETFSRQALGGGWPSSDVLTKDSTSSKVMIFGWGQQDYSTECWKLANPIIP